MIENYIDEIKLFDFANDLIIVSELDYAEEILNILATSNNKKITSCVLFNNLFSS